MLPVEGLQIFAVAAVEVVGLLVDSWQHMAALLLQPGSQLQGLLPGPGPAGLWYCCSLLALPAFTTPSWTSWTIAYASRSVT